MNLPNAGLALTFIFVLTGCVGPFPAGIRTGSQNDPMESLAERPATNLRPREEILRQKTDKTALLLLTPEGPRSSYPVDSSYRYFLKIDGSAPRELPFLRVESENRAVTWISSVFPVGAADEWIGISRIPNPSEDRTPRSIDSQPNRFPAQDYELSLFSTNGILRRHKITAVRYGERFSVAAGSHLLRFWRNDGWALCDLNTGSVSPEPDRVAEIPPNPQSIQIPGTKWRIHLGLPSLKVAHEALGIGRYELTASSGDGLELSVYAPLEVRAPSKTRAQFSLYAVTASPDEAVENERYYRTHQRLPVDPSNPQPERKSIGYVLGPADRYAYVRILVSAPFERWEATLARLDSVIRFEEYP